MEISDTRTRPCNCSNLALEVCTVNDYPLAAIGSGGVGSLADPLADRGYAADTRFAAANRLMKPSSPLQDATMSPRVGLVKSRHG